MTGETALWDVVVVEDGCVGRVLLRRTTLFEAVGFVIGSAEFGRIVAMRLCDDQSPYPAGSEPGELISIDRRSRGQSA